MKFYAIVSLARVVRCRSCSNTHFAPVQQDKTKQRPNQYQIMFFDKLMCLFFSLRRELFLICRSVERRQCDRLSMNTHDRLYIYNSIYTLYYTIYMLVYAIRLCGCFVYFVSLLRSSVCGCLYALVPKSHTFIGFACAQQPHINAFEFVRVYIMPCVERVRIAYKCFVFYFISLPIVRSLHRCAIATTHTYTIQ